MKAVLTTAARAALITLTVACAVAVALVIGHLGGSAPEPAAATVPLEVTDYALSQLQLETLPVD